MAERILRCILKNKKNIFNFIFLIVVFGLTIYGVFKGQELGEIIVRLKDTNPVYLMIGVFCVALFIFGESTIIHYLLNVVRIKSKRWTCFLYSCVGFFFSCITPSASGGQPMQIFYMKKNKIPIPTSTVILMIVTITYKLVLVVVGLFVMFFQRGFVYRYLRDITPIFYLGIALNVVCVFNMMVLVFNNKLAKWCMLKGLWLLEKLHLMKHKPDRAEKLAASMDSYNDTAKFLRANKPVIGKVFLMTMLQRFAMFFATYFTYKALGLRGASIYDVVMLQAVISVSVDMLPLPGGMGISEKLFLTIFVPIFGPEYLMAGLIISRGLGYYVQLLLSAVLTIVANFTIGYKNIGDGNELDKDGNIVMQ